MSTKTTDLWMPIYIADYLGDTMHLTTAQHGAYLLLIMAYWRNRSPIPDDDKRLCTITRMSLSEWKENRSTLAEFFIVGEGFWSHKRINDELERADRIQQRSVTNGAKGGRPPKPKNNLDHNLNETQTKPEHNPDPNLKKTQSQSQLHSNNSVVSSVVDSTFVELALDRSVENRTSSADNQSQPEQNTLLAVNRGVQKITPAELVFSYWQIKLDHPKAKLDRKLTKLINESIRLGYTIENLQDAIDGCSLSPHHMGINDRNTRYDSLELILRDSAHIAKFISIKDDADIPPREKKGNCDRHPDSGLTEWGTCWGCYEEKHGTKVIGSNAL